MLLIDFLWYGFFLLYFLFCVFSLPVVASASEMLKDKKKLIKNLKLMNQKNKIFTLQQ
jgi:hypothetical protein